MNRGGANPRADAILLAGVACTGVYLLAAGSGYMLRVFAISGIYALSAIGYQFIFGQAGALALSQGAFMGLGAYVSGILALRYGMGFGAALPISVGLPMLLALLVAIPVLRLRSHYFALATLILSQMVLLLATEWVDLTGGANGLAGIGGVSVAGMPIRAGWPLAVVVWSMVAAGGVLAWRIMRGRRGLAYAVMREHPAAAAAIGLDAGRLRLLAFVLAAAFAGLAGSLYVHAIGVISPDVLGFPVMVTILTIVVIGGRRGVAGAIAGAVLVIGLPEWVRPLRDTYLLAYGAILLLAVVVAPGGLLGALGSIVPRPRIASAPGPGPVGSPPRGEGVLLEIAGLSRRFGGVHALDNVSVRVRAGEVLGLIGPNGSGKTTLLNCVTGLIAPDQGRVLFGGSDVTGLAAHALARAGIARTFQTVELVDDMAAVDAVAVARPGDLTGARGEAMTLLDRVGAGDIAMLPCGALATGVRRRVEIARALALAPRLLLLDEPAAGLNESEQADLARRLRGLADGGLALLVVEHNMGFLARLADRLACLDGGRLIAEGTQAEVRGDARVIEAYLGSTPPPSSPTGGGEKNIHPAPCGRGRERGGAAPLLRISALEVRYGRIPALRGVDIEVHAGEAVGLLGANGAGKSTLIKAAIGLLGEAAGDIVFDGVSLLAHSPHRRARAGIGYCPEGRRVFPGLSVAENLAVACWAGAPTRHRRTEAVFEFFPDLAGHRDSPAWQLSGGQQQMLAIGRSLMNAPRLLLLDEPSLGLSPRLTDEVIGRIPAIVAGGTAVLLAEQNASRALSVCDTAYVLTNGRVTAHGPAATLAAGDGMRAAFLGVRP